ncbi:DUF2304 domain-containing protein [Planctobacterium marinum]|uniref:DUF2304 domain-containing protein n=1 Tax=Planctobacterium marinum TaxID=1631968 RepID=A0AA48HLX7_9ALTE|nr:hypothetical protein MACH26_31800 [Planctobacterium marinum]
MPFSNPQIVSAVLATVIAGCILLLVRRDYLIQRDAVKWLLLALAILLYGLNPGLNDIIGFELGISYPPIIPLLIGFAVVLIKLLLADIERARLQMSVTRLIQKVAILEAKIDDNNQHLKE